MRKIKLLLIGAIFSIQWCGYAQADVVITTVASPPVDQKQGYIERSGVRFMVTTGQVQTLTASGDVNTRPMRMVKLLFNNKTVTVQNSGHQEVYVKAQDPRGNVVLLDNKDYAVIKQGLIQLSLLKDGQQANEVHDALSTALSLLQAWPRNMPVLIWQNQAQKITALDQNTVVAKSGKNKASNKPGQVTQLDESILQQTDAALPLPAISPLPVLSVQDAQASASSALTQNAIGISSSDTSVSLCDKIGTTISGSYPLISATLLPPFTKVKGTEAYTAVVGGVQCLGRCGGRCVDSISGVNGFGKNAYSQDCLDHDMCVTKRGSSSSTCDFIFSDAANDFFSTPCGHDLALENTVVSNSPFAASEDDSVSSKLQTFVVFTIKNNGNSRLPHNRIFFDIYVDGKKKKTFRLPRILESMESARYFYPIGAAKAYRSGTHRVKIRINAKRLIQTATSNDRVTKAFNLI